MNGSNDNRAVGVVDGLYAVPGAGLVFREEGDRVAWNAVPCIAGPGFRRWPNIGPFSTKRAAVAALVEFAQAERRQEVRS